MWFLVLALALGDLVESKCNMGDAKWKAPPIVSQPNKNDPSKVQVDWSASIKNPSCVDEYYVWVWKQGQNKTDGRKFTISDYKVTNKLIDIEPCVFYNFGIELFEKDWINKHLRESEVVSYNSAALPSFNSTDALKYFSIGYFKDPRTGIFDVEKASIKLQTKFITFASCIKHLEVTGRQKVGIAAVKEAFQGPVTQTTTGASIKQGKAFGIGRQPGESGRPISRDWRWSSSSLSAGWKEETVDSEPSTNQPASQNQNWEYISSSDKPSSAWVKGGQGYYPGSGWDSSQNEYKLGGDRFVPGQTARSGFSKQYVQLLQKPSSTVAGPVKKSPPFLTEEVEIIVPVEACKEYDFELKVISPQNSLLGKVTKIHLPTLADIPDYIPPTFTSVLELKIKGGVPQLGVSRNSPIPESCLPEYLEAMDAFANRLEGIANKRDEGLKQRKSHQDIVQDNVELTQAETLSKHGCKCSSPRLEVKHDDSVTQTTYESVKAKHKESVFGVYLYEGMREGRPYYKLDLEQRSLPGTKSRPSRKKRSPRIGRVDGGSSTTQRPWNYGSGRSVSSSSGTWTNIPIQRVSSRPTVALIPRYLYWEPKAKQWLVSPQLGASVTSAEFGSAPGSKALCPADSQDETWQSKVPSLRSGSDRWLPDSAIKVTCSPDF